MAVAGDGRGGAGDGRWLVDDPAAAVAAASGHRTGLAGAGLVAGRRWPPRAAGRPGRAALPSRGVWPAMACAGSTSAMPLFPDFLLPETAAAPPPGWPYGRQS